jgi:hypothetical protein
MKNRAILITSLSIFSTHAMKEINHFSIKLYETTINVNKKPLYAIADNIDFIIVGKHQQQLLDHEFIFEEKYTRFSAFNTFYQPGLIGPRDTFFAQNEDDESASDDETYKPFEEENRCKLRKKVIPKQLHQTIIEVTEPYITFDGYHRHHATNVLLPRFRYKVKKFNKHGTLKEHTFYGEQAILEASNSLAQCYENVLMLGSIYNSIVIPTLSADLGFPREKAVPIALTEIINFTRNYHPYAYNRVELVVKKRSEFAAYTTFLMHYWIKPCLLILAHKDTEHFLYNVPREIINNILQLMHPTTY